MNKAFVKEPDTTGSGSCPRCASLGTPVGAATLDAQLPPEARRQLADAAFFCSYPACEVAYFDQFERFVGVAALPHGVYPKDFGAPICACFGLTLEDVELDVAEGVVTRVRAAVERARSPDARCTTASAIGRSCVAEIQGCYMRLRSAAGK